MYYLMTHLLVSLVLVICFLYNAFKDRSMEKPSFFYPSLLLMITPLLAEFLLFWMVVEKIQQAYALLLTKRTA